MGSATGAAHLSDFVIERLPIAAQNVLARNNDVDFFRSSFNRLVDFCNSLFKWAEPGGEAG